MRILLGASLFYAVLIACLWLNPPPQEALWALFIITETGTFPKVLITLGLFSVLCLFLTPRQHWKALLGMIFVSMAVTQGMKTVLKPLLAEPRPFVQAMTTQPEQFYALSRAERAQFVAQAYAAEALPPYLLQHRMHETGYSMPSGHSLFALSIAMLSFILLGTQTAARKALQMGLALWAALMLYSRVLLGMHSPADLALSLLIAAPLHWILAQYWQNYLRRT